MKEENETIVLVVLLCRARLPRTPRRDAPALRVSVPAEGDTGNPVSIGRFIPVITLPRLPPLLCRVSGHYVLSVIYGQNDNCYFLLNTLIIHT